MALAKRKVLLRAYRDQLRHEDLEDCYSQATLELIAFARRGGTFADAQHLGNTLELRFLSRIRDVRRALSGRSPIQAAVATAVSLGGSDGREIAIADCRAELEALVLMRSELQRVQQVAPALTHDQRLALAAQLADTSCAAFCRHFGWSPAKYRKVAQRGRARLKRLVSNEDPVPLARAGRYRQPGTYL